MRAARAVLLVAGVAAGAYGLWLGLDLRPDGIRSALVWLVAGVLVHDALLAPLTVLVGAALWRVLPRPARTPVALGVALWGVVTVAAANVLSGQGGKPDNDTLLGRPYVTSWLVLTAVLALVVTVLALRSRRRAPTG